MKKDRIQNLILLLKLFIREFGKVRLFTEQFSEQLAMHYANMINKLATTKQEVLKISMNIFC